MNSQFLHRPQRYIEGRKTMENNKLWQIQIVFYATLFLTVLITISSTLFQYPLFPLDTENLDWSNAWLATTVIDFYGSTLCFIGVVVSSETTWTAGILWSLGFCLLGSPISCLWIMLWLWNGRGSLRLQTDQRERIEF